MFDLDQRASGVLLHLTSLPGAHGCGDLGPEAHAFAQWLADAGQRWWQMLPIGPVGYGNSPYSATSAFAGSPLFISTDRLVEEGLLPARAAKPPSFPAGRVDYAAAHAWRERCVRAAFTKSPAFETFCNEERSWLDDYALFMALKREHGERAWTGWNPALRSREAAALREASDRLRDEVDLHKFEQFLFDRDWRLLREKCAALGVGLIGDMPIYVAHDSAEVWAHPDVFFLDDAGEPTVVAGVPPDYFSETGQRWGNPIYRWDALAASGYGWWVERFRTTLRRFDAVRLDHFIGFTRYWEVPGDEETAKNGTWKPGPGAALFEALRATCGKLPLIAEDLGAVTPEVLALRDELGLPGMKVLQFAFGSDPQAATFRPWSYEPRSVAYAGTHDNDTIAGWFADKRMPDAERRNVLDYLGRGAGGEIGWQMLREVFASVAHVAIATMQDLLGLGPSARMNTPGTSEGNWEWRMRPGQPGAAVQHRLRELSRIHGRVRSAA